MGVRLKREVHQVSAPDMIRALVRACINHGVEPMAAPILAAQSWRETNHKLECYSFGFVKAHADWKGDFFYRYATENMTTAEKDAAMESAADRVVGQASTGERVHMLNVASHQRGDGKWYVELFPDHPGARFRGYASLQEGAEGWLDKLCTKRYRSALRFAEVGNAVGYVTMVGKSGYYTEPVKTYRSAGFDQAVPRMRAIYERMASTGELGGHAWAQTLPQQHGEERERRILEAIRAGWYVVDWSRLEMVDADTGVRLKCLTAARPVAIGTEWDHVYPSKSAKLTQWIADELGCVLPTPGIVDARWEWAGIRITPTTMDITSTTAGMVKHSDSVQAKIAKVIESSNVEPEDVADVVASPCGKAWVLVPQLWKHPKAHNGSPGAANYGWHRETLGPIQPVAIKPGLPRRTNWFHGIHHSDYSQADGALVRRDAEIWHPLDDVKPVSMADVYTDPRWCHLVGLEEPLPSATYPNVPAPPAPDTQSDPAAGDFYEPGPSWPTVRKGDTGDDVKTVQKAVHVRVDGVFGTATENALKMWQAEHGLTVDGIAGPQVFGLIDKLATRETVPPSSPGVIDLSEIPYKAANIQFAIPPGGLKRVMIHTAEKDPDPKRGAELLALDCSVSKVASWNYSVDGGTEQPIWCSVKLDKASGAARGARDAVHIELVTRIAVRERGAWKFREPDWTDEYHTQMLANAKALVRAICHELDIPMEWLTLEQVLAGEKGLTTHAMHTKACHVAERRGMKHAPWYQPMRWASRGGWARGDNRDPGPSFPKEVIA